MTYKLQNSNHRYQCDNSSLSLKQLTLCFLSDVCAQAPKHTHEMYLHNRCCVFSWN